MVQASFTRVDFGTNRFWLQISEGPWTQSLEGWLYAQMQDLLGSPSLASKVAMNGYLEFTPVMMAKRGDSAVFRMLVFTCVAVFIRRVHPYIRSGAGQERATWQACQMHLVEVRQGRAIAQCLPMAVDKLKHATIIMLDMHCICFNFRFRFPKRVANS